MEAIGQAVRAASEQVGPATPTNLPTSLSAGDAEGREHRAQGWLLDYVRVPRRFVGAKLDHVSGTIRQSVEQTNARDGIFITGPTGSGKTYLAVAILRSWLALNPPILKDTSCAAFGTIPDILIELRSTFNAQRGAVSEENVVDAWGKVHYAILDDLGAEKVTDWSISAFYSILSRRYNNMLPTVVTSNLGLQQLHEWEPRMASRLAGMAVIHLSGPDRRLKT